MAWTPRNVTDQVVEFPSRFNVNGVPSTIEPNFGTVVEPGTPINRSYLQPIEDHLATVLVADSPLTVNPALVPTGNTSGLRALLGQLANRILAITGAANWWSAPATTLAAANTHHGATAAGTHGSAVAATANTLMHRDASGRAQVANGVAAGDIASFAQINNLRALIRMGAM